MNIANINEIDKWINVFYGEILMHGTEQDKEKANFVIDYINFLEKSIGIKKCVVCNKKFVAKRKNQKYCSKNCNAKSYWNKLSVEERRENYKKASYKYKEKHLEGIKEYQSNYRKNNKEILKEKRRNNR